MRTLNEIPLKPNDRQAIEAATELLRQCFPIEQMILFGSKARGDDDAESDIDLLILTARPVSWEEKGQMRRVLTDVEHHYSAYFSLLVVAQEDWLHGLYQVLPIRDEVDRDGVAA